MMTVRFLFSTLFIACFFAVSAQQNIEEEFQEKFITAEDNSIIELPAGTFHLTGSLWLDSKKNVTIKGAGMDKTILNFKGQTQGAEGIKVTDSQAIRIEDLTVQNSKGDAIKVQETDGIAFVKVRTEWTGRPKKTNGAYGLYPVQCENVLIDACEAIGASDAGVYVGQSNHIIVRNCMATKNVAGIEIENSTMADVYGNEAYGNTGGILVFDLPGLIQKKGGNVRVFKNKIYENNLKNFAPEGNTVGMVSPGTGVLVLATSDVEIYNNDIINNRTFSMGIASYFITETPIKDKEYDPYPAGIFVHDNNFNRGKKKPTMKSKLGVLLRLKYKKDTPNIIYDGIPNEEHLNADGTRKAGFEICLKNNINGTFGNLDAANDFKNSNKDKTNFDCERPALKEAELAEQD